MTTDLDLKSLLSETTYFGPKALKKLAEAIRATGSSRAVIITDPKLADSPVVARVWATLTKGGITPFIFAGANANPTTKDVADGAAMVTGLMKDGDRPALVAVGGGSSMDAAKGIALAATNPQRGRDLDWCRKFANPALPIVAVPTTAGTGAETNAFGVITDVTDPESPRKFYVGSTTTLPAAVILDPDLTIGLPPEITAATGMDALVHALESYMSRNANLESGGIALRVIQMIATYLPRAVADGSDYEARSNMLLASHLAGIAMADTGLGICHAIGHSLGARFNIPHGMALTMILPAVLTFNRPYCQKRLATIAFALGVGDSEKNDGLNSIAAIDAITSLAAEIGITQRLSRFGVTVTDFDRIAADALDDYVMANTPRTPTPDEIHTILAYAR